MFNKFEATNNTNLLNYLNLLNFLNKHYEIFFAMNITVLTSWDT